MSRYDHPSYRATYEPRSRSHHNARTTQPSRGSAASVDAAVRSGAIRPLSPSGRVAHPRTPLLYRLLPTEAHRITALALALFTATVLIHGCAPDDHGSSLFCAEAFCDIKEVQP